MLKTLPRPDWLVVRSASEKRLRNTMTMVERYGLNTVCQSAQCPNIFECWQHDALTVMILGNVCTRSCRFCATVSGDPAGNTDSDEPHRVAEFVRQSGMDYIVISSVARDDLPDGGAGVFAEVLERVRAARKDVKIEVLVPDFAASVDALRKVVDAKPDVLGHNIETVRRLSERVRDRRAKYETSLQVLKSARQISPELITKSGMMLGLGESREEAISAMADLRDAGVEILTIGQYLQPSGRQLPVARYVAPEEFENLRAIGCEMGFRSVFAGPFVRSSYHAADSYFRARGCSDDNRNENTENH